MNQENSVYEYKWELIAINKEQKIEFKYNISPELVSDILRKIVINEMEDEIEVSEEIYTYIKNNIRENIIKECEENSNMIDKKWIYDFLNRQYDKVDTKKIIYLLEKIAENRE